MEGIGVGLGVLGFWGSIAAVVVAGIWYGIREREAQHETLRRMIESGQPIDQALMDKLLGGGKRLDRDLKVTGLILLFVALGLALLAWIISPQYLVALLPLLGVSVLVICTSIGLLVASKVVGRAYRKDNVSESDHPTA